MLILSSASVNKLLFFLNLHISLSRSQSQTGNVDGGSAASDMRQSLSIGIPSRRLGTRSNCQKGKRNQRVIKSL